MIFSSHDVFSLHDGPDVDAEDITYIFEDVSESVEYIEVQTSPRTYTRHTRSGGTVENVSYFEVRRFWLP